MILVSSSAAAAPVAALTGTDQPPVDGRRTRRAFRRKRRVKTLFFGGRGMALAPGEKTAAQPLRHRPASGGTFPRESRP